MEEEAQKSTIIVQEETSTTITKDSGYSTSCNSQSKSGSFKSKSTNSAASSGESSIGFCDASNNRLQDKDGNNKDGNAQQDKNKSTRRHKKKKKMAITSSTELQQQQQQQLQQQEASTPMDTTEQQPEQIENENTIIINETIKEEIESQQDNNNITNSNKNIIDSSPKTLLVQTVEEKDIVQTINETESNQSTNVKEFNAIVSMKDGVVLYCTTNLTDILGFPPDMWLGRSFIDFVHPNDRSTFAECVASCMTSPDDDNEPMTQQQITTASTSMIPGTSSNLTFPNFSKHNTTNKKTNNSVHCCLRHYKSLLKLGYGITDKRVHYIPCQLIFSFKEIPVESSDSGMQKGLFLIITARAVNSVYKIPNEKIMTNTKILIKHNNNCVINHVSDDILQFFGYLPHRIIGTSIFNFYHPEDLPYIKKVYQDLLKDKSNNKQKIQSKPIKFRCQNGHFATVETEWSSFVNPWNGKLEFVVGYHNVIQGPEQPDVCSIVETISPVPSVSEEVKQSKIFQEEIHLLLKKPIVGSVTDSKVKISHESSKGLSSFMESLIKNTVVPNTYQPTSQQYNTELKLDVPPIENISERDSLMLGEISPHHDYSDKSSSETPPSYNQLNYDDNIQRFFESKPKTSPSHESNNSKSDETNKDDSETSGDSGGYSGGSGDNKNDTRGGGRDYHQKHLLTEESLTKHNADMEKRMVQKHKEQKLNTKYKNKQHNHNHESGTSGGCNAGGGGQHGIKRSGSHSWENEPFKSAKQTHGYHNGESRDIRHHNTKMCENATRTMRPPTTTSNINLWPPFNASTMNITSNSTMTSTLVPYLYIPNETSKLVPQMTPNTTMLQGTNISAIPYVSPLMYQIPLSIPMYSPMLPMYSHLPISHLQPQHQPPQQILPQQQQQQQLQQQSEQKMNLAKALRTNDRTGSIEKSMSNIQTDSFTGDSSSYHSSLYSLLKTDESSPDEDNTKQNKKQIPQQNVKRKPTLAEKIKIGIVRQYVNNEQLEYQIPNRSLNDVLSKDLVALSNLTQPDMVNIQLSQLYSELELEGITNNRLKFEDGFTSSSDGLESFCNTSSDEQNSGVAATTSRPKQKPINYDKLSRLFEENAPIPPPPMVAVTTTTATTTTTEDTKSTVINTTTVVVIC